ncbi:MAG: hypothetical protein WC449_05885 [Candidatus Paceibacterota bacterium]
MNMREYHRITILSLPRPDEVDLRTLIRKYNDAILLLSKRDKLKEKRIQELEELIKRTSGKRAFIKYFGDRWRIRAEETLPFSLLAEYSTDGFLTIASVTTLAP